jgi:hypothetical protein
MYGKLFSIIIKYLAPPVIALFILQSSALGPKNATLVIAIALSLCSLPWMLWLGIKILPTLLIARPKKVFYLIVEIVVAFCTLVGFWLMYILTR